MNYRNWLAVTTVVISTVTLTACAQNSAAQNDALQNASNATKTSSTHQHADGETHDGESHGAHDETAHGSSVHTHSTKLNYSSEPATILPGKPATMTLQIVDKKTGAPINDFEVVHDKKLHFIVVSSDLQFFNHIHPQFVGDGKFQIETTLPRAGGYRLYADYKPRGEEGEVALQQINVGGAQTTTSTPTSSTRLVPDTPRGAWLVKSVSSHDEGVEPGANATRYNVALMPMPSKIEAGKDVMLHFQVRDAAGKAVSKLEPYLGAQGHCVILSSDPKTYLHTHPMDASHDMGAMKTGEMKMDGATKMSEKNHADETAKTGADVMFHTNFPSAGLYKIWGQFMHNGKIVSAPFVVNVGTKSGATKTAANTTSSTRSSVAIPANAQRITVSLPDGYKNGAAKIQAGKPVAITFKLTSNAGCGNTITVPAAKWSETLEVGQSATVVYTPTKSGALGFACGMNMMKGSIVVQ